MWGYLTLFSLTFLVFQPSLAAEWDASNFPNPTAGQFKQCNMRTTANICDPDGVLDEQTRYRLDHELKQLESRTRQNYGSFCDKKGVTAAMAIARHVRGGSEQAVEQMANDMLQKWTLDSQCKKAVVFVVSTDDQKFWVARDDKVPVYANEFTQLFQAQRSNFQHSNYQAALAGIIQGTWEKALSKAGSPRQPNRGGNNPGGNNPQGGQGQGGFGGQGGGGKGMSMPSFKIPAWFWFALFGVIIPLLCCCCCLYCCCCRGKGGARNQQQRNQLPTDPGMGGGVPQQPRGGGGGNMFSNILSSAGGAGIGSMLGRLLSGGGNRGGGGGNQGFAMGGGGGNRGYGYNGGGAGGGNAYPDSPVYDDNNGQGGGGLYPSREVKDRGGGGSWA